MVSVQSIYWFGVINQSPHVCFGKFLGEITHVIFENLKIVLLLLGQFQNPQKCTRKFIPNRPPKHVITSTNII